MGEAAPLPSVTRLLSHYTTWRDPDGRLVIHAASNGGPVLGCLVPTALAVVAGTLLALIGNAPGWFGPPAVAVLVAAIAVPILVRQGARTWIVGPGSIQEATTLGQRRWRAKSPLVARSVVVRREIWRARRRGSDGSTDTLLVAGEHGARLPVLSVHNWAGQESRLASGGVGSLARAAPNVSLAPEPLATTANLKLKSAVCDAISELTDLLAFELRVPVTYEIGETARRPR